ncbi:DUF5131 family protein [Streptomyces griseus]|uniref:DUF5131 family protein n=1 Tax=Streptomyces griseus TaxID=1911 RepID=UPI00382B8D7F
MPGKPNPAPISASKAVLSVSKIEWTEQTWNPTTGCDRISPGCDNCYALTMAKRLKGMGSAKYQTDGDPRTSGPGFGITNHPDTLTEPLRWKKPRKVFVNSMSDLFHARVPRDFLAQVFAVMAATPQHTYQILTKRPERAARILGGGCKCGHPNGEHFRASMEWAATSHSPTYVPGLEHGIYHRSGWPLPNVWIGTSVENQKYADLRIPALLKTPAAVRFLSCEPLLGPVDLSPWLPPISPMPVNDAPQTWDEWTWPNWVPAEVRNAIEDFWGAAQGRSPRDWMRNMHEQGAPAFGATLRMNDGFGPKPSKVTGRFVHAWNNIGRLVLGDNPNRTFAYTSFGSTTRRNSQPLDWVIVGGESGPGARAFAPAWAADVAKTASDAGVATFIKQLGAVWARDNNASDTKGGNPDDWPVELRVREYPQAQRAAA